MGRRGWARGYYQLAPAGLGSSYAREVAFALRWQVGAAHEVVVYGAGGLAALGDGPDDEGLAATGVACGEDAGHAGGIAVAGLDAAAQ